MDDDALSDGGGITDEQYGAIFPSTIRSPSLTMFSALMENGLEKIRDVMGDEASSGLDDKVIQDALWECYFDVEQAIPWLFGMSYV